MRHTANPGRRRRLPYDEDVAERHEELRRALGDAIDGIEIFRSDDATLARGKETRIAQLRRRSFVPEDDRIGTITLVDENGVLRWESASAVSTFARGPRRRRRAGSERRGTVVQQYRFEHLEKSQVGQFLATLDKKVNTRLQDDPAGNLLSLTSSLALGNAVLPAGKGRILVMIHGTFSHSQNLLAAFTQTAGGTAFLESARSRYDQVLFFDHPTLQVSPVMNALDLARVLKPSTATVDLICHSRGGLVARWWIEALAQNRERIGNVALVGCPLAGTSLAAPPRLRRAMELLSNVFNTLRVVSGVSQQVAPFMIVVTGLLRVLSSVSKVVARTPLADTAIAMVPGLVGMSRVGDNPEILRLRRGSIPLRAYHAVVSDFEPEEVGWRFWRLFTRNSRQRLFDYGADYVFDGPNDLVVDTDSMRDLEGSIGSDLPDSQVLDFKTSAEVHHLNYFAHAKTLEFLVKTFGLHRERTR